MIFEDSLFADIQAFMHKAEDQGITIVSCPRCQQPCKIAAPRNPDARILRLATEETAAAGMGLCVNCAATDFLRNMFHVDELLKMSSWGKEHGTQAFLLPHVQAQFAEILTAGQSDAAPTELDWPLIIEHWDLPFPKAKRQRKPKL